MYHNLETRSAKSYLLDADDKFLCSIGCSDEKEMTIEKKIRVLFLHSETNPQPFATIHSLLMRYFDRERIEVHVACLTPSRSDKASSYRLFETIPDLHIHHTDLSQTISTGSKFEKA